MCPVERAIAFIESHQLDVKAFLCADGLVCQDDLGFDPASTHLHGVPCDGDDMWCEEFVTFPVVDGHVDIGAVREYLGY